VKRVRYLAGLTGLAPVAVGLIAPAAAHAATATQASPATAKTVRLPAASPATGCTGHTEASNVNNGANLRFWYNAASGCIGDVNEIIYIPTGPISPGMASISWSMNIYHDHNLVGHQYYHSGGYKGFRSHTFYVHKRFSTPVQVCVKAFSSFGHEFGGVCKSVG
jgi:hypothetical protein